MTKLIPPERCTLAPYFVRSYGPLKHAGALVVTVQEPLPKWNTWDKVQYNPLAFVSTEGQVDGVDVRLIPVKINTEPVLWMFDTEKGDPVEINRANPAIAFFMGSDDWSYGLRFPTYEERDKMLAEFGEELGFMDTLQGHN